MLFMGSHRFASSIRQYMISSRVLEFGFTSLIKLFLLLVFKRVSIYESDLAIYVDDIIVAGSDTEGIK